MLQLRIAFLWGVMMTFLAQSQDYTKNRDFKKVKMDSDVMGFPLELSSGQKITSFPFEMTKDKSVKWVNTWNSEWPQTKFIIEYNFVNNIFITDGLKNCSNCRLRFEKKDESYSSQDFYINYKKRIPFSGTKIPLRIMDPQFQMPAGKFMGRKIETDFKVVDKTQVYDPVLGSKFKFVKLVEDFFSTSENSFIVPKLFDATLKKVQAARNYLWMEPSIDSYLFFIWKNEYARLKDNPENNGFRRYTSTADLSIQWKFMDAERNVKRVIPTRVVATSRISDPTTLFEFMVKESLASLISQDSLFAWIQKENLELSIKNGHGEVALSRRKMGTLETSKVLIKEVTPAVVTVHNTDGSFGSGFVVSENGYIVTNHHVIDKEEKVKIRFHKDTTMFDADIVGVDEDIDLALLKVNRKGLPFLNFGNSEETEIGETVYAIGTPGETKLSQSVSRGIISGKREWEGKSYLQTDVSINPGNSGGPLINEHGEVIGVVALKMVGLSIEGLSFVIPSNVAMEKLDLKYK